MDDMTRTILRLQEINQELAKRQEEQETRALKFMLQHPEVFKPKAKKAPEPTIGEFLERWHRQEAGINDGGPVITDAEFWWVTMQSLEQSCELGKKYPEMGLISEEKFNALVEIYKAERGFNAAK